MKLWLVIYAGTQIGGSAGPLPYGMEECQRHRDRLRASQQEVISTGFSMSLNRKISEDERSKAAAMRFECEWRERRPAW
ncbi:hypothetical protein CDO26_09320 [Sinorhizobium meliloti]|uniref:hypothetical protein n=1 Tax=Rhizobium meliloti TaxID=382 RepID=UPI000B49F2C6|nr:hypothetical protein [Sinorhizobium meliloti]ASP84776.1 hypothetical protein CDO26_09320 [Sinorhizobium meliloti]MQW27083.1 hypothetical protein [Sinorhizobium meliloti]